MALYIVVSCLYIYWFKLLLQDLTFFAKAGLYKKSWNFGQVVAITAWAPPVIEYIHLELRKCFC